MYSKPPKRFGLKEISYPNNLFINDENDENEDNSSKKFTEKMLHPLLSAFVYSNEHFYAYTKTINHEKSKKEQSGKNKWIYPDLVGVYFPYTNFEKETLNLYDSFKESKYKVFSFEMKKSINFNNLREVYFQALSNSNWANEGYLVTLDIDDSDDELLDEIRSLNATFGIGVIKLNALYINQSEILFPSKVKEKLDWSMIDRLVRNNEDFKDFVNIINDSNKVNKVFSNNSVEFDKIYLDEEYDKYIKSHNIVNND